MVTICIIEMRHRAVGNCKYIDLVVRIDKVKEQTKKEIQGIFQPSIFRWPRCLVCKASASEQRGRMAYMTWASVSIDNKRTAERRRSDSKDSRLSIN